MYESVSVIVRAYNAEKYIRKALNSILSNTYEGLIEIIVCYDQGSKDRSLDVDLQILQEGLSLFLTMTTCIHEDTLKKW
jgi:cellulose synthase/poly-beta-1,6-N-acetylglucosamine synthase-like glycosyltransferase